MIPPLFALFSWPLVVLALARNLTPAAAFILALLGGFLFLPEIVAYDLPMLPALTKHSIPALTVLLLFAAYRWDMETGVRSTLVPKSWFVRVAVTGLIVGTLFTVAQNGDPLSFGPTVLPGMRLYDGLSQALSAIIMLLPLFLAHRFLAGPESHLLLLRILCVAGLGYSLLALVEVRMSPQMNSWTYGFFPHSFVQHYRDGGWRPLVFLSHGLVLAIFFCMVVLAAAGLTRLETQKRGPWVGVLIWMVLTLLLCKSMGALIVMLALLPAVLLLKARGQLIVACLVAGLVLTYPIGRSSGLIPIQQILIQAERIDPERARSLLTRVENEDMLLAKAQTRPLFGWGAWGRSRIFDPKTGMDMTITDGHWVGALGVGGWVKYLGEYGLLCVPLFLLLIRQRRDGIGMETSLLALLLAANLIDLIPNSSVTPVTWMIAGAIWGRLGLGRIEARAEAGAGALTGRGKPVYRRPEPEPEPRPEEWGGNALAARKNRYTRQTVVHHRQRDLEPGHER